MAKKKKSKSAVGYTPLTDKEKNILRSIKEKTPGSYITPLHRKFPGQKYISVANPTYSEGRQRVKTKEYEAWLKKERATPKPKDYRVQSGIKREPGLIRIAEAMRQADINDDLEYLMRDKTASKADEKYFDRKQKVYKKGMLRGSDIVYINGLETNTDDIKFIAEYLGEDSDWVLNKLDQRTKIRDVSNTQTDGIIVYTGESCVLKFSNNGPTVGALHASSANGTDKVMVKIAAILTDVE